MLGEDTSLVPQDEPVYIEEDVSTEEGMGIDVDIEEDTISD